MGYKLHHFTVLSYNNGHEVCVAGNEAQHHTSLTQFFIYASFMSNSVYLSFLPFRFAMTAAKVSCTRLTKGITEISSSLLCRIKLS